MLGRIMEENINLLNEPGEQKEDIKDNFISFTLYNESDYGQPYLYTFKDNKRWFNTLSDTVYINKKD